MQAETIPLTWRTRIALLRKSPGLRARMTISYVLVTVGTVFSILTLLTLASGALSAAFPASDAVSSDYFQAIQRQARTYALVAGYQARGGALNPNTNFMPGHAHTIAVTDQDNQNSGVFAVPYVAASTAGRSSVFIALLVAPDGRLVASSYPARYPAGMSTAALAPSQTQAIDRALAGQAGTGTEHVTSVALGYAAEPVWSDDHQAIGAIFLQVPEPVQESIFSRLGDAMTRVMLLLVIVTPIGVLFGWVATRGLVWRVERLALATTKFAGGDYSQRVVSAHSDEIGQLEQRFNQMAEQIEDDVARRQRLAEQNARLEERSRISRELHDAVSQDLFSLRMLADGLQQAAQAGSSAATLQPHITLLEQTTANMTREMRALLLELRPTQLDDLGLAGALQKLATVYNERLGVSVVADVPPDAHAMRYDVRTEHALLRVAQEALTNAARHSGATRITLRLACDGPLARLTIADNGRGFDADDRTERHGLGLRIMQERIEELSGAFDLQTAPGQGACVTVTAPRAHDISLERADQVEDVTCR